MLVQLTSSLYVPGKITDPEHVVVDIGTGYYVKKVCASWSPLETLLATSATGFDSKRY